MGSLHAVHLLLCMCLCVQTEHISIAHGLIADDVGATAVEFVAFRIAKVDCCPVRV